MRIGVVAAAVCLAGCGSTEPARPVASSLVAAGRVLEAGTAAPAGQATINIQALSPGRAGGTLGCTGDYLVGDWTLSTGDDGRFAFDLRLMTTSRPVCLIVFTARRGDARRTDSTWALTRFKPIGSGAAPDTVKFEIEL